MKKIVLVLLSVVFAIPLVHAQIQCDNDSTGLIALPDLKTGLYLGHMGGFYPGGSNKIPAAHKAAGQQIGKQIKPLDTTGVVDWVNGHIVFAAFGASTTGEPFNHFIDIVHANPDAVNPCMSAVNVCYGGKGLDVMEYPDTYGWYWDYLDDKLGSKGFTPEQVQVAYFKSGSKSDDPLAPMDVYVNAVADRFEACLQLLLQHYPNLKLVFLSGFIYGGYGDPTKEFYDIVAEPGSYHNNWSVKWLIERQINGTDPGMVFQGAGRVVPFCAWGPNEWADGLRANLYDGLTWDCESEFEVDGGGYHLNNLGRDHEAQILWDFFTTNALTKKWFLNGPKWSSCGTGRYADGSIIAPAATLTAESIKLYPNPGNGEFVITLPQAVYGFVKVMVTNNLGQVVYQHEVDDYNTTNNWVVNIQGQPAGIYHVSVLTNTGMVTKNFELTH